MAIFKGTLSKMAVALPKQGVMANYRMVLEKQYITMQPFIGEIIKLRFNGEIYCKACGRLTKKSFSNGFCFPCSQRLACCDLCIMKPEICHFSAGTCREPRWGEAVCMQDHIVYLANSSGIKVGITQASQVPTRWIDQGATQALPIFQVHSRYQSGLMEVIFRNHVSDKTNWHKMLKGVPEPVDLIATQKQLIAECKDGIEKLQRRFGISAIRLLTKERILTIAYPVQQYPKKVKSLNFNKNPDISGVLQGIKGQYLILDTGVLNIRKFSGYKITMLV